MEAAYAHWRVGQSAQASAISEQVLQAVPLHAPALHLLGLIAHAEGDIAHALLLLERACSQPDALADFHSNHAEVSRQAGLLARAEQAARCALVLFPGHPSALSNLGIILQQAGRLEESIELLTAATQAAPDDPNALSNLGNTQQLMGYLNDAMKSYTAAIACDPAHEAAYANLAALQLELGRFDDAAHSAGEVLELNPQHAQAYLALAQVHRARHRPQLALQELDKLLSFARSNIDALRLRVHLLLDCNDLLSAEEALQALPAPAQWYDELLQARLWTMRGRDLDALAACQRAYEAQQNAMVVTAHALALGRIGQAEQASANLRRLLDEAPSHATAWLALSELDDTAPTSLEIDRMRTVLEKSRESGCGWRDAVALHRAWGHAMLANDDEAAAMTAYDFANGLEAQAHPFAAARLEGAVEQVIDSWSPLAAKGQENGMSSPVFIIGMPNSGAELVRSMLREGQKSDEDRYDLIGHILTSITQEDEALMDSAAVLADLTVDDYAELAQYYLDCADSTGDLVDACHANFLLVGFINQVFPAARFIFCRREPLENCLACYQNPPQSGHAFPHALEELARYHRVHERLMRHWTSHLPDDRWLQIDHARLLDNTARVAEQVASFSGMPCRLPYDAQLARARRQVDALARLRQGTQTPAELAQRWEEDGIARGSHGN
ncbi:sulfotransferase [Herbaspirillum huttiense]|uniref:tetratricopeptide repeat-containing sulfotransferase family protein n=1 Tax=Herbaspirillum huttiense TaxID=863372 RepID=UPI001416F235|nr:tetratricopeptide repeat-containing sulfotransferase family protein [Herbaspirillum huttiense]